MAETTKLSVEKALKKIRSADPKSKDERRNAEMEERQGKGALPAGDTVDRFAGADERARSLAHLAAA